MRKFLIIPLLVVAYLLAGGPTASAHSGKQGYVYLGFYDDEIDGRVELPVGDLGAVLGIDFGTNEAAITRAFAANSEQTMAYVRSHVSLSSIDGEAWDLQFGTPTVLDLGPRSYLLFPFEVDEEFDGAPRDVVVEFDAIIEADDEKDALLHIENDVRSAVFNNESDPLLGFSTGLTVQTVSLETAPTLTQLGDLRGLGTDGVRTGTVHILFVAVLMAPIALLARRKGFGDPAPPIIAVIRRASTTLAAFGGGVAGTLWLTGLGVIELSSRVVVAATSISLLAAAIWALAAWRRPVVTAREPAVVAVLGALQGLGLGDRFVADKLDQSRAVLSLVGFTVGVAVAVLVVAVLTLLPMTLLRRTPLAPVVLICAAAIGALYAGAWILEGAFDADWSIDRRFANPWRVWPRNLVLALLMAAIAAGIRAGFAAGGMLRPVGSVDDPVDDELPEREKVSAS